MAMKTINAKEILEDIKAGMDNAALMEKYKLSEKGLQSLFKKLIGAGVLKRKRAETSEPLELERPIDYLLVKSSEETEKSESTASSIGPKGGESQQEPEVLKPKQTKQIKDSELQAEPREGSRKARQDAPERICKESFRASNRIKPGPTVHPTRERREVSLLQISALILFLLLIVFASCFVPPLLMSFPLAVFGPLFYLRFQRDLVQHDLSPLPETFLELSCMHRKKALDLAWFATLTKLESHVTKISLSIRKVALSIICIGAALVLFGGGLYFNSLIFGYSASQVAQVTDNSLDFFWPFFVIAFVLYSLGCLVLYPWFYAMREMSGASSKNLVVEAQEKKLRELATVFVRDQYRFWLVEVKEIALGRAMTQWNLTPGNIFVLEKYPQNSQMPYKAQSLTFIFSNGYVSVISNIAWNVHATSYSLVDNNEPIFDLSDSGNWSTEEFHYQDVVEVTYRPGDQSGAPIEYLSTDAMKQKLRKIMTSTSAETLPQIEGYLVLGLVNGQKKEYPTGMDSVANFLTVARERVREAKIRSRY